jgi:iron(III) transport system ATP-binding protein
VEAVQRISFEIATGEFYTLLGPSGCGKSTTLRCIAGFETPEAGDIWINDELVFSASRRVNAPPQQRNFGIVFQSYAIWPHMTVFENVAFPLLHGRNRIRKAAAQERVSRALHLVQMGSFADRPSPFLSGGQQQRIALARALVHEPEVLLLDEPLSNLDAKLREDMRLEIRELVKRLKITTLYVTHDQLEALTMTDRVAVMNSGQIIQEGSPRDIYKLPASRFVANFIGLANFLEGRVTRIHDNRFAEVYTRSGMFRCVLAEQISEGDTVLVMIRPEDISVCRAGAPPDNNVIKATVKTAVFTGEMLDCWLRASNQQFRIKVHPSTDLQTNDEILIRLAPERCRAILLHDD